MEAFFRVLVLSTLLLSFHGVNVVAQIEAIYQFGDSISDPGNLVHIDPNAGCSKPPYGQTFGHPTGRCSDGLLIVDYIAQSFKVSLISPYLDKSADFTHGANFAVAGATARNTSQTSLPNQLNWFKTLLATKCTNPADCKPKLGNALFLMGEIGGNDYNGEAWGNKKTPEELRAIVPSVIQVISDAVNEVIDLGATRIVVPGNFPAGCMTIYLAGSGSTDPSKYDELGCLKDWNDLASYHNDQLQGAIKTIQQQHPDVKIAYGDYFSALKTVFQQGPSIGFDKDALHKACCGAGNNAYNFGGPFCGTPGAGVCPNPNTQVSWDGVHLTQHAYQVMADQLSKQIASVVN